MAKSHEQQGPAPVVGLHVPTCDLGDQLKAMFGDMSAGPMPPGLLDLADRLEEAFQRGELFDGACRRPRAS